MNMPVAEAIRGNLQMPSQGVVVEVAISQLTKHQIQARKSLDEPTVEEYLNGYKRGDVFPPLSAMLDGEDYYLFDGNHRLESLLRFCEFAGTAEATPEQRDRAAAFEAIGVLTYVEAGDASDAKWAALKCNTRHGLRRSRADIPYIVESALTSPHAAGLSYRQLAEHTQMDPKTFRAHWFALSEQGRVDPPGSEIVVTRGDSTYTMQRSTAQPTAQPVERFVLNGSELNGGEQSYPDPVVPKPLITMGKGILQVELQDELEDRVDDEDLQAEDLQADSGTRLDRWRARHGAGNEDETTVPATGEFKLNISEYAFPDGDMDSRVDHARKVLTSSKTCEHYTPEDVMQLVYEVFGTIDLDPCSNAKGEAANVRARHHFTAEDNGLNRRWDPESLGEKVSPLETKSWFTYTNHPFSIPEFKDGVPVYDRSGEPKMLSVNMPWIEKVVEEHRLMKAAGIDHRHIALTRGDTSTAWSQKLSPYYRCEFVGRITFVGNTSPATFPVHFYYLDVFGAGLEDFIRVFSKKGVIRPPAINPYT
jgi:hypothetical protein